MVVHLLEEKADFEAILAVLLELRPYYTLETLSAQINKQRKLGYQLAYVKSEEGVLGVAGFYVGEKLAWGKHVYIDDLVTSNTCRSTGVGKCLMDWFKGYAKKQGCTQIHLDSGVQRFAAHKFYLREGFKIASHHFSLDL